MLNVWPARAVLMVRPRAFGYNPQNADNTFARQAVASAALQQTVLQEFDGVYQGLQALGLQVHLLPDHSGSPDAIFPNNWFSTHPDGTLVLYPMKAPSRRQEVFYALPDWLQRQGYVCTRVLDGSAEAEAGLFLEGTGVLVIDSPQQQAYAALSERASRPLLERFAQALQLKLHCFEPLALPDGQGKVWPIYHTNVLLALGQGFALWCPEAFARPDQRAAVAANLQQGGRELITLSLKQVQAFAGNMLQVMTPQGHCLLMSRTARQALTQDQRQTLQRYTALADFAIPTIEAVGGGSLRCMLAEILLPRADLNPASAG